METTQVTIFFDTDSDPRDKGWVARAHRPELGDVDAALAATRPGTSDARLIRDAECCLSLKGVHGPYQITIVR